MGHLKAALLFALSASRVATSASSTVRRREPGPKSIGSPSRTEEATRILQSSEDPFTVDLLHAVCPDLTETNKNLAPDEASCAALCESDPGCDLWQYCPEAVTSCNLHDSLGDAWTPGNWARCYVSTSSSSRDACLPDRWSKWVGRARSSSGGIRVPETSVPASRKRGLSAYLFADLPDNTTIPPVCGDGEALGMQDSWYYTWQVKQSSGDSCAENDRLWGAGPNDNGGGGVQMGAEFVPMIIGVGTAQHVLDNIDAYKAEWTRANVHYLLGYNEPDPSPNHPHAVNADIAAADWPLVQQVAASFDPPLTIVSPAPASEDFDEDGRSRWLDEFFGNCTHNVPECDPSLIKHIAFHDYKGSVPLLERRIDGMAAHYGGRPLWLTEYSIGRWDPPDGPLRPEQDAYLKESLVLLENHPSIFRYVWFHSRDGPGPWGGVKDLLVWDDPVPTLTSTGTIYKEWPEGPQSYPPTAAPPTTGSPTTPSPSGSPTAPPPSPVYEPEPGLFLLLGDAGESCTSACSRSGLECTVEKLAQAASYGNGQAMANTALELGVECASVANEKTGSHFPQIRPDLMACHPKVEDTNKYSCDKVSTWVVLGKRVCACAAPGGAVGDPCAHSAECVSGTCLGDGHCE